MKMNIVFKVGNILNIKKELNFRKYNLNKYHIYDK